MKNSFTNKIRKIIKGRAGRTVKITEMAVELDFVSDAEKRPLYRALIDLRKSAEITRVARGE